MTTTNTLAEQAELLNSLAPQIETLIDAHIGDRNLWYPSDLIDPRDAADLRERARGLPGAVRAGLALNLLTEEGLPHFHRLLAKHLGEDSTWMRWNNVWTAEEDRHGCVLRDYARDSGVFELKKLEQLQYAYLEAGFNPDWGRDPYKLLAYTSLQEKATQRAHANLARLAAPIEPRLQHILSRVAADESRHHKFYREAFALVLAADPDRAIRAAWAVMPNLAMPGHTIPGFRSLSDIARVGGIYGPVDYCRIVTDLLQTWGIATVRELSGSTERLRDKLMALPARLERFADLVSRRKADLSALNEAFLADARAP